MNADRYICCDEHRRETWLRTTPPLPPPNISGIDYVEVAAGAKVSDPTIIDIILVRPLPRAIGTLTADQVSFAGGVRFPPPRRFSIATIPLSGPDITGYKVKFEGAQPTDFSPYILRLVANGGTVDPPTFIDPRLAAVDFSFKVGCPTDADCADVCEEAPEAPQAEIELDYRVRDYPGFRRLVFDRLRALIPDFAGDDAPDLTTTLAELIAYRADQQSYRLDWVGTEPFLDTARSRTSVTRIARLVDYSAGEGSSARLFARFDFAAGVLPDGTALPAGSPLLLRDMRLGSVVPASIFKATAAARPVVFETMAPLALWQWRSRIGFHDWGDRECLLPRGATSATLVWPGGSGVLTAEDLLVLVELRSPDNGKAADADPLHRHPVRLTRVTSVTDPLDTGKALLTVEWDDADALPFDLVITPHSEEAKASGSAEPFAVAYGNVMLCDHGMSLPPIGALGLTSTETEALRPKLEPSVPRAGTIWQPTVDRLQPARVPSRVAMVLPAGSASAMAAVDPAQSLPALGLRDDFSIWKVRRDLLKSDPFSRDFVVETTIGGQSQFRFGDGISGMAPTAGSVFKAVGRFGSGRSGNVGAGAIGHVVVQQGWSQAAIAVDNPLAARGGTEPEPIEVIRVNAPQAYRVQDRAVTAEDYADVARRHPAVANALAFPRWTGAWQTMMISIDRKGGLVVDEAFRAEMLRHIEHFRLMGFDVRIEGARPAPLDIRLKICVRAEELRSAVAGELRNALRPSSLATGEPGFFHPDEFTFGSPLLLSQLVARAMAVRGVLSVDAAVFKRLGRAAQGELQAGIIKPQGAEVLQLSDDPNFSERGRLEFVMRGGR